MIRQKDGVHLDGLRPEIKELLAGIDVVFHEHGTHLCVTCGTEGHGPDDPHSHGFAVDCRTHELPTGIRQHVRDRIAALVGPEYTVLLESFGTPNEHIHIQLAKAIWREIVEREKHS